MVHKHLIGPILLSTAMVAACSPAPATVDREQDASGSPVGEAGDTDTVSLSASDGGDVGILADAATNDSSLQDSGTCVIQASNYDQNCVTNSDCALVPPGGDACHPCSIPTGYLQCHLAAVNINAATHYMSDLSVDFAPPSKIVREDVGTVG
jgi:hypothetical protein